MKQVLRYIARLDNQEQGAYKAWPIGREEFSLDRGGRLAPPEETP